MYSFFSLLISYYLELDNDLRVGSHKIVVQDSILLGCDPPGIQLHTLEDWSLHTCTYLRVNTEKFLVWTRSKLTDDTSKTKKFRRSDKNTYYIFPVCTVLLPPGVNPIAVNKYIKINNVFLLFQNVK